MSQLCKEPSSFGLLLCVCDALPKSLMFTVYLQTGTPDRQLVWMIVFSVACAGSADITMWAIDNPCPTSIP